MVSGNDKLEAIACMMLSQGKPEAVVCNSLVATGAPLHEAYIAMITAKLLFSKKSSS